MLQSIKSSPTIESYSDNQNIYVGEKLKIYVTASPGTSDSALSYQWYKNNTLLQGETKSWLEKAEAITDDSGFYNCVVQEDGGGSTASNQIEVFVTKPSPVNKPIILNQTTDMELIAGSSVTLRVNAIPSIETDTLSYQWYKDGTAINGTDNTLNLTNVTLNQAGSYQCLITEENLNTSSESEAFSILVKNPQ